MGAAPRPPFAFLWRYAGVWHGSVGALLLLSLTVSLATFSASMAFTLDDHLLIRMQAFEAVKLCNEVK